MSATDPPVGASTVERAAAKLRTGAASVFVREAAPHDLDTILDVQEEASLAGLKHIFTDADPYPADVVRFLWTRSFQAGQCRYTVAEIDSVIVGVAITKPPEWLGIEVVPALWGKGVADLLYEDVLATLTAAGHEQAIAWFFEKNHRSLRFSEKRGWKLDGRVQKWWHEPHPTQVGMSLQLHA